MAAISKYSDGQRTEKRHPDPKKINLQPKRELEIELLNLIF